MKTAVIGCGAVGSFYGAKLARAGHETHFLLRSDYEAVRRQGVTIRSPEGDFNVRPRCARTAVDIGVCDLVLVCIKTTANEILSEAFPPLVGPGTAVLTLQNGLGNEEILASVVGPEKVLGGLCFVCLNRTAPGVVEHLAHGRIEMGEFNRWPEPRTHDIAGAFRSAGIPCTVTDNLERTHWEKLVWNIAFNGLGVASCAGLESVLKGEFTGKKGECLTTDLLLASPQWESLVRELMSEVISGANARRLGVDPAVLERHIIRTREMGAYKPSTLIDFERGSPLELETMFREPLRQAQAAGVAAPRLAALCKVLDGLSR